MFTIRLAQNAVYMLSHVTYKLTSLHLSMLLLCCVVSMCWLYQQTAQGFHGVEDIYKGTVSTDLVSRWQGPCGCSQAASAVAC